MVRKEDVRGGDVVRGVEYSQSMAHCGGVKEAGVVIMAMKGEYCGERWWVL